MGDFMATITDPDLAREFQEVLGTTTIPLKHPLPVLANVPGKPHAKFYIMDVYQLTTEQRIRLADHLARKFKVPRASVLMDMQLEGFPILADHCTIVIKNPLRWI